MHRSFPNRRLLSFALYSQQAYIVPAGPRRRFHPLRACLRTRSRSSKALILDYNLVVFQVRTDFRQIRPVSPPLTPMPTSSDMCVAPAIAAFGGIFDMATYNFQALYSAHGTDRDGIEVKRSFIMARGDCSFLENPTRCSFQGWRPEDLAARIDCPCTRYFIAYSARPKQLGIGARRDGPLLPTSLFLRD